MNTFTELNLPKPLAKALMEMKFETPTPIQAQAIPVALEGKDLIGCAQTGTGKTAAFAIPMITHLMKNNDQKALILVPTRELATQVCDVLRNLTRHLVDMRVVSIIGGMSMQPQTRAIQKGFRIMVATPGRLVDHLSRRHDLISQASILVLDEADRMLDMGFAPQLKMIWPRLPKQRQTLLFSATVPHNIMALAQQLLKNPTRVQVGEVSTAAPLINQQMMKVKGDQKNTILLDELNAREGTVLVFARTQRRTDRVARYLNSYGVSVTHIHGGRTQGQRNRALAGFRDGEYRVMIATDIAARGIDIDHVAHVINYDLPEVPEDYIHRIGRTGRAGRTGEALALVAGEEQAEWRAIEQLLSKKGIKGYSVKATPAMESPIPQGKPTSQDKPAPQARPQRQARPQQAKPAAHSRPARAAAPAHSIPVTPQALPTGGGFKSRTENQSAPRPAFQGKIKFKAAPRYQA